MKYRFTILKEDMSNEYDSEGNRLTVQQAEFFKNSKIRDNKGRLLVCYHGTNAKFDRFDKLKVIDGSFGRGFYFTANESEALEYGSNVIASYINVANPYYIGDTDDDKKLIDYLEKSGVGFDVDDALEASKYGNIIEYFDFKPFVTDAIEKLGYDGIQPFSDMFIAFEPNQIKSIYNKTPTNSDNINESYGSPEECQSVFFNALKQCTEDELINFISGKIYKSPPEKGPFFILPNGDYLQSRWGKINDATHVAQTFHMADEMYRNKIQDDARRSIYDWAESYGTNIYNVARLDKITVELGWVRGNPGTTEAENRTYFVIPYNATDKQLCAVRDCLEKFEEYHREYQAYFLDSTGDVSWYVQYSFWKTPDMFLRIMRNYINNGKKPLDEKMRKRRPLTDSDNINESLMMKSGMYVFDTASSLMNFLRNQKKDIRILYDANLDKYFACDGNEYIHWDILEQAQKEGYYHGLVDYQWELDNYQYTGVNGGWNENDEYIDPYLYYIIFSPDNSFELGNDDYDEQYDTSIGRFLTRECDIEEIDLYDYIKREMK